MELMNFHRLRGSVKVLSAAIGASVVVAMGALTVAYPANEVRTSTASTNGWPVASIARTPPPSVPETPFATPTFTATPCPKRATMPC
jgi:hypothetical protein